MNWPGRHGLGEGGWGQVQILNTRHKAVLFVTLVLAGSGLLAGARLNEALGIVMLGAALAWAVGSGTASRAYLYLRGVPGMVWPLVRILLLMVLGGCLLVGVAVWTNFNSFLVVASLTLFGMLISPFGHLPSQRSWVRVIVWTTGVLVFFLAAVGAALISGTPEQNAEHIGELAAKGLIALPVGMLWLTKGWRLILAGISAQVTPGAAEIQQKDQLQGTFWQHLLLVLGVLILSVWLGSLAFLAFSDAVYPLEAKEIPRSANALWPAAFMMVLGWWPYECWQTILEREPNLTDDNLRSHKRTTIVLGGLLAVILCVAATFGIQNGTDRRTTARVTEAGKDLGEIAAKIGAIKGRDLHTAQDYIRAYTEMGPLVNTFDSKLKSLTSVLSEAEASEKSRGPFSIQRLFGSKEKEWLAWDAQLYGVLNQDSELTKKEVSVINQMAGLPENRQIDFWKDNFRPLLEQENTLREKIASLKATMPPPSSK